ncbi:MAG: D-tyrosyl-tRNA(Tyr) deacylase [Bacteroidetes bacterium]|nr:D-tyrosyl-tRNA(Tyr) deacylase [Bacteroidota bacterium]
MRLIIQRVQKASVSINGLVTSEIGQGLLVLAGIEENDTEEDVKWLAAKTCSLRIFSDDEGKMNLDLLQIKGEILLVSQFTLFASTKKGNRPSFIKAARPEKAVPLYQDLIKEFENVLNKPVKTGQFGADMKISLVNDGPVTIFMDSKLRE